MSSEERTGLLLDELSEALGGDARVILTEGLERFAEPARGPAGHVDLVLAPASTWQLRVIIRWARDNRLQLLPQGANSGLVEASTPGPDDVAIILSTDRMVGEGIINPSDRTAVVPAGTRLSKLNEELAPHGLRLPIDLGADPSVGGMAATNTGGARMIRHGDMRRHVLGVEAVLADDEVSVVDEISTLRKDNSGLSLTQLLVGSGGSLGVITRVAVEVEPIPSSTACAWLVPTDPQSVIGCLGLLESRWGSHLSAFEVASANAIGAALDHVADLRDPFTHIQSQSQGPDGLRVLVEFETLDATSAPAESFAKPTAES
ncbi:MAG: FAD-binding oxidoreductase, partial [Microthrixaceae bacterium]